MSWVPLSDGTNVLKLLSGNCPSKLGAVILSVPSGGLLFDGKSCLKIKPPQQLFQTFVLPSLGRRRRKMLEI
jgi:hypothetical protein